MDKFLTMLEGSKTYIASIALLVIPFLVSRGYMTQELAQLVSGIIGVLMGSAKYVGVKLGRAK